MPAIYTSVLVRSVVRDDAEQVRLAEEFRAGDGCAIKASPRVVALLTKQRAIRAGGGCFATGN